MVEITVWDVSHGSASYIRTPNNRHVVVDLGDNGEEFSPLLELHGRGLRWLDVALVTHPHRDHLDDIFNLARIPTRVLWTPRHLSEAAIRKGNRLLDAPLIDRYLELAGGYTYQVVPSDELTVPDNFGGVDFQVFSPRFCDDGNLNNHSLVLVVQYAGLKMVIPGDNEGPSWRELLGDQRFRAAVNAADVFLAPHHGRDAGYCGDLLQAMGKPRLVVISDGRFGDTSATSRYSAQASGWTVFDPAGKSELRKCVTTRSDGHITVRFGWNGGDPRQGNFLNVTTSKVNMNAMFAALMRGTQRP